MNKKVRTLTQSAVFAALYVVLTLTQDLLLPGSASNAIQFRVAEALNIFAVFSPSAIYGVSVGCLLFNIFNAGALPLDFFVGTAATLLATFAMYRFRTLRVGKIPLLSLLMPVITNSLLVGWELTVYVHGASFWFNAACVCIGEAAVMMTLGLALYFAFSTRNLGERLLRR